MHTMHLQNFTKFLPRFSCSGWTVEFPVQFSRMPFVWMHIDDVYFFCFCFECLHLFGQKMLLWMYKIGICEYLPWFLHHWTFDLDFGYIILNMTRKWSHYNRINKNAFFCPGYISNSADRILWNQPKFKGEWCILVKIMLSWWGTSSYWLHNLF